MFKYIANKIKVLHEERDLNPVLNCKVYRNCGCSHVDGPLCNLKTCAVSVTKTFTPTKVSTND